MDGLLDMAAAFTSALASLHPNKGRTTSGVLSANRDARCCRVAKFPNEPDLREWYRIYSRGMAVQTCCIWMENVLVSSVSYISIF